MAKAGRRKGKDGELELANLINKSLGHPCLTRNLSQTRNGGHDLTVANLDSLEAERLDQMSIEVKRHQSTKASDVKTWWKQTHKQAMDINKIPVLFYRGDREDWKAMLPLSKSLSWDNPNHCITMGLPLFIQILKKPDLVNMQ